MATITYRASATSTIPASTTVKGVPLTNAEMDGNLRSIQTDLDSKVTAPQLNTGIQTATDNALALAIALG